MLSKLFMGDAGIQAAKQGRQMPMGRGGAMSRLAGRVIGQAQQAAQQRVDQSQDKYAPQEYLAPQSYEPFAQSFQPQQRPPVTDIYQRGAMPNDLLARYNSMAQMLQQQQAAMVPRTQPQMMPQEQTPWMGNKKPNLYTNFAQLFGGRNG